MPPAVLSAKSTHLNSPTFSNKYHCGEAENFRFSFNLYYCFILTEDFFSVIIIKNYYKGVSFVMKKKILSLILVIALMLPIGILPANSVITAKAEEAGDGYQMPPIGIIVEAYHNYYVMMRLLTGDENYSEEHYNLIVDDIFSGIMNTLCEECGIDFSVVWTRLPETNDAAEKFTSAFKMDIPAVQAKIIARETELEAEGKALQGGILRIIAIWIGIVDECKLCCEPVEGSDTQMNVVLYVTYRDGRVDKVNTPVYYDKDTLTFTNKTGGPVFLGFYFNAAEGTAWTGRDVWQRKMCYGFLYDLVCYMNPFFVSFETQRIKFVYDNKDWMIQLWKGRYFITNGAEVGIYTRPAYMTGTWYECADDTESMPMSLRLSHAGEDFFYIPQDDAWWLSKFKIGTTAYLPKAMTLTTEITVKDQTMLEAFTAALNLKSQLSYTVDGLTVTITW